MKNEKIILTFSIISTLLLIHVAFVLPRPQEVKTKKCFDMAVSLERARHHPNDDLTVSNQDISGFQKNMIACIAD